MGGEQHTSRRSNTSVRHVQGMRWRSRLGSSGNEAHMRILRRGCRESQPFSRSASAINPPAVRWGGKRQYMHMARCEGRKAFGSLLMAHLCASGSGSACCPPSSAPGRCSSTRRTQCPPRGSTSFNMSTRRAQGHQRACAEAISAPYRLCSESKVGFDSISTVMPGHGEVRARTSR